MKHSTKTRIELFTPIAARLSLASIAIGLLGGVIREADLLLASEATTAKTAAHAAGLARCVLAVRMGDLLDEMTDDEHDRMLAALKEARLVVSRVAQGRATQLAQAPLTH